MTTFTTAITALFTLQQPVPNYVVNLLWKVTGVDGNNTVSIDSDTQFNSVDQEGEVIPFDSLTQEQVINWIPANQIDSIQACVQSQLDLITNPPVIQQNTPLPWSL